MPSRIYLSSPHMCGAEMVHILSAFDTNWIAPLGPNVDAFERAVRDYTGAPAAVALSSGTAALHLALRWLGVGSGDTVIAPTLTFAASVNPVTYLGGTPVFVDAEPGTVNMSVDALARAFKTYRPKAVIAVHLYGHPARMDEILALCADHGVPVLEDAAESLGTTYKGRMTGTLGDVGVYSFNGNKIVTTSGGGMLVSANADAVAKALFWATQAREPAAHYEHREIGYNYRMSNVLAGIGVGQMTAMETRVAQKTAIHRYYVEQLEAGGALRMVRAPDYGRSNHWLSVAMVEPGCATTPARIVAALAAENIEARPVWKPMHRQPVFAGCAYVDDGGTADDAFARGVCLPSDTKMTPDDLARVVRIVRAAL